MSKKGKVKELLFDINSSKLFELDEEGNLVENQDANSNQENLEELFILENPNKKNVYKEIDKNDFNSKFFVKSKREEEIDILFNRNNEKDDERKDFFGLDFDSEKIEELKSKSMDVLAKIKEYLLKFFKYVTVFFNNFFDYTRDLFKKIYNKVDDIRKNQSVEKKDAHVVKDDDKFDKIIEYQKIKENKKKINIDFSFASNFLKNKNIVLLSVVSAIILTISALIYMYNYYKLPVLEENEIAEEISYKNFNAEVHPMQIFSSNVSAMKEYKGEPSDKGDGKTADSRYLIYSLDWFGKKRKSVLFYNSNKEFNRIKLDIGNDSASYLYENMVKNLGEPIENNNPLTKGGYAVWIKDAVRYKLIHRGSYATIDISIANYENKAKLDIGKYPVVIQDIKNKDLNKDGKFDERILLLGNRESSGTTNFSKIYILVWDGQKTYLSKMAEEYDGGNYPQIEFKDYNNDGIEDFIISTENTVLNNYNVFEFKENSLKNIYSGYEI